jgi:hypothetical protein
MSEANDSILVTPGTGATVATQLVNSKEYQVVMVATDTGHIQGTAPTYIFAATALSNVAASRTTHLDVFNASGSGKIMKIIGVFNIPALAAVTGVGLTWEIIKTSAVGTGGAAITGRPYDSANAALPSQITCRSKPTGGATTNFAIQYINTSSEETSAYATSASMFNHLLTYMDIFAQPLVLREGEGMKMDQTTSSAVGTTTIQILFTLE